eukprot:1943991-Pyramimonas_sp.AAC.1
MVADTHTEWSLPPGLDMSEFSPLLVLSTVDLEQRREVSQAGNPPVGLHDDAQSGTRGVQACRSGKPAPLCTNPSQTASIS